MQGNKPKKNIKDKKVLKSSTTNKKRQTGLNKNKGQQGPNYTPFIVGNRLWMLRSKHGRDKLFASPALMWQSACEYFQWCDDYPWLRMEQTKATKSSVAFKVKDGEVADITTRDPAELTGLPTARPYTLSGLCLYLGCAESYFRVFKMNCSDDFLTVINRIEQVVETQQFEGAVVGAYNANIIARKLGLIDKSQTESEVKGEITIVRKIIHKND